MRRLIPCLLVVCPFLHGQTRTDWAQLKNIPNLMLYSTGHGAPVGSCVIGKSTYTDLDANLFYRCGPTGWIAGGSGGGSPGGSPGQVQTNCAGAFCGVSIGGDALLNSTTGALVVTKTNGASFGDAATKNTGTAAGTLAAGDHTHTGVYEPANANIQSHITNMGNPHSTTASQVGAPPLSLLSTLGDTVYRDNTGWQRLAGNILNGRRLFCQAGTGTISAAPTWCQLATTDIPDLSATYAPVDVIASGATQFTVAVYDSTGAKVAANAYSCKITASGLQCGNGTQSAALILPELAANGVNFFGIYGGDNRSADACIVMPSGAAPGTSGQALTTTGTTATMTDSHVCQVMQWAVVQLPVTLTTTGTSGAATFSGNVLNIPQYVTPPAIPYYQTVQVAGVPVIQRAAINYAAGANVTLTPTDDGSGVTTLTIASSGGGGSSTGGFTPPPVGVSPMLAGSRPPVGTPSCSSSASPAVCGANISGAVVLPTGTNPTLVINTSAVTSQSRIILTADSTTAPGGASCNSTLATIAAPVVVTARTAGASFTVSYSGTVSTTGLCVTYRIDN